MTLKDILKLIFGVLIIVTPELAGAARNKAYLNCDSDAGTPCSAIPLPKGCENYEVIRGNPMTADIILLGEIHDKCEEARFQCTVGILKEKFKTGLSRKHTTVLFELANYDQAVLCSDYKLDHVTKKCRGWNDPSFRKHAIKKVAQHEAFFGARKIFKLIMSLLPKEEKKQKPFMMNELNKFISYLEEKIEIEKIEQTKQKNKSPSIFNSNRDNNLALSLEYQRDYVKKLLSGVEKASVPSEDIISSNLETEFKEVIKTAAFLKSEEFIKVPNQALLKTIKDEIAQGQKTIIANVGKNHLQKGRQNILKQNKNKIEEVFTAHTESEPLLKELVFSNEDEIAHDAIIDDLYKNLDELARPYAVLSCPRELTK